MTILHFGDRWDAPVFDASPVRQVPTPVGQRCLHCGEGVAEGDVGLMHLVHTIGGPVLLPIHRECQLRGVLGGLDHVEGRCQYTGHCNELREVAGRTLREDAIAVWDWARRRGGAL